MPQRVYNFLKVEHDLRKNMTPNRSPLTLRNTWLMQWIDVRRRQKTGVPSEALVRESVSQLPVPLVCQAQINFLAR
jgi:hypothetical protein